MSKNKFLQNLQIQINWNPSLLHRQEKAYRTLKEKTIFG